MTEGTIEAGQNLIIEDLIETCTALNALVEVEVEVAVTSIESVAVIVMQ